MTLSTINSDVNIANIIETRSSSNPNINITSAKYYDKDGNELSVTPSFVFVDVYAFEQGGEEYYEIYAGISDDPVYKGIWLGLSDPNDEIRLYHKYSGDVSSFAVLRHSTADKPDAMLIFTLKDDHQIYYEGYSDFKSLFSRADKLIDPMAITIWNKREYPIIIQNNCSIDTIYITIGEQIEETAERPDITMKIGVWTNAYNTDTNDFIFNEKYNNIIPEFVEASYNRPSVYINSKRLKTWHYITKPSSHMLYNWIEPNITIYIRRAPNKVPACVLTYIQEAIRIAYFGTITDNSKTYMTSAIVGKMKDTNEIYVQHYRSNAVYENLFYKGADVTMAKCGPRLSSGVYMEEDIPATNKYIGNWYTTSLESNFNYYNRGRLIVVGYNVYLIDKAFTEAKLILKLQRWDHWITGSANPYSKAYVIRGKDYTLVISYDPDTVYNTSTIVPYNIPFLLYKHDTYIGDNVVVDNTRLRFVSSSKGIYYDNTDVNKLQYSVVIHGNIKAPDIDSIYRTIDDLYKRIAQLESK